MKIKDKLEEVLNSELYKQIVSKKEELLWKNKTNFLDNKIKQKYRTKSMSTVDFVESISPFKANFPLTELDFYSEIVKFYDSDDYKDLSIDELKELSYVGIDRMMDEIENNRRLLLSSKMLLEEDFSEKRLEFVVIHGYEAVEFKNKDMDDLLKEIRIILEEIHYHYFTLNKEYALKGLTIDIKKQVFNKYVSNCLKRFDTVAYSYKHALGEYYLENIEKLTEKEIVDYGQFKDCPISILLQKKKLNGPPSSRIYKIKKMVDIANNLESIYELVAINHFIEIAEAFANDAQEIMGLIQRGNKLYDMNFTPEESNGLMIILETVPKFKHCI